MVRNGPCTHLVSFAEVVLDGVMFGVREVQSEVTRRVRSRRVTSIVGNMGTEIAHVSSVVARTASQYVAKAVAGHTLA